MRIYPIVIFLFFFSISSAQNLDSLFRKAENAAYNYHLSVSDSIFHKLIRIDKSNYIYFNRLARNYLWRYLNSNDTLYYNRFSGYSNIAEQLSEKEENNPVYYYERGLIFALRAAAYIKTGGSADALWSAAAAVDNFNLCLESDSSYYDAYFGLGFFEYAFAFTPDYVRWLVKLLGLESDLDDSILKLNLAYKYGKSARYDADYQLAKIESEYLGDFKSAENRLRYLTDIFPENPLFNYEYFLALYRDKNYDSALTAIDSFLRLNIPDAEQIIAYVFFLKAQICFQSEKYSSAIEYFDKFFKNTRSIEYTGIASYRQGISYWISGDADMAHKKMVEASFGNNDLNEDRIASNSARQALNFGFEQVGIVTGIENNILSGNYKKALEIYADSSARIHKIELKIYADILFADALIKTGGAEKALSILSSIPESDLEDWQSDYFFLLRAEIEFDNRNYKNADEFLTEIGEFDDYQYKKEKLLEVRILQRKINEIPSESAN